MIRKEICPKCSVTRKNKTARCCTVFDNGNKFCHHCGWDSSKEGRPKIEYKKPSQSLPQGKTDEFRDILKSRGITEEVAARNKISWNSREVLFPYMQGKEIVNIKYRGKNKSFRQEAGAMKIFYGLNDIIGEKDIFIVEGEWDKLACEVAGYENVASVPDGAPSPEARTYTTKFKFIDDCEHLFAAAERVIIAVDNDLPGKKLESELVRRFDPERCWLVKWPLDCKDANEVLIKHGMVALMECLENPRQMPIDGVYTAGDYFDALDSLYEQGLQGGNSTGWLEIDNYYTVRLGEMTIITGIPSHGKSTWLTALMVNLTHEFGWKWSIFSPENQPLQRYMGIIAGMHIGKPFGKGYTERINKKELESSKKWLDEHYYFTQPNDDDLCIDSLLNKARETVKRYGVNGIVIDPWNEVDSKRPAGISETEHINQSLAKVRRFGRLYQVHMFIVAHPQKLQKDKNDKYPAPTAYEISGSANWYNKGDAIISVWRDPKDETKKVVIHIQKVRFREVGKVGEVSMNHDVVTGRYSDVGEFESHYKDAGHV
jgi:twinkle protein